METIKDKKVLISGASITGLSAALCMNAMGYKVTVVELAKEPRVAGGAVDIKGPAVDAARRMGIYEQLKACSLHVDLIEFKNTDDVTEGSISLISDGTAPADSEIEIERDKFAAIMFAALDNEVEFMFSNSIRALDERTDDILVSFRQGPQQAYHFVLGCDGIHSGVRRLCFGPEANYAYFLKAYSSISIINKLMVPERTMHMYGVPDKSVMLNAYNGKTDIIFCFNSDEEIPYDYRDEAQQRNIILRQFSGIGWRMEELLEEIKKSDNFYFDKFCQIKMPNWTKGRVALIGDAAYCASPAAGMGASLAIIGAATLADALQKHNGDLESAFCDYNTELRPFIEEVQANAEQNIRESFIPRTEEAIHIRNTQTIGF